MVICPVAIAVGCRKCPIFSVCPVKGVIGDYKPDAPAAAPVTKEKAPASAKPKSSSNRKRARSRRPRK